MAVVALLFSILAVALALGLAAGLWLGLASANEDDGSVLGLTDLGLADGIGIGIKPDRL